MAVYHLRTKILPETYSWPMGESPMIFPLRPMIFVSSTPDGRPLIFTRTPSWNSDTLCTTNNSESDQHHKIKGSTSILRTDSELVIVVWNMLVSKLCYDSFTELWPFLYMWLWYFWCCAIPRYAFSFCLSVEGLWLMNHNDDLALHARRLTRSDFNRSRGRAVKFQVGEARVSVCCLSSCRGQLQVADIKDR